MSNAQLTAVIVVLFALIGLAQLLGYVFVKLGQPKVVGEILAGIVLGPALLGRLPFVEHLMGTARHNSHILGFVYWLGLLLLMFVSGAEMQQLFGKGERRTVSWLVIVGTGIPFVLGLVFGPHLIRPSLAGPHGNRLSLIIILAVGVAVTSVPVVSKIFADLNILDTRFARLILGVAVLEDIVLWLALAIATSIAAKSHLHPSQMALHLLITVAYFVLGLTLVPRAIRRFNKSRWNVLAQHSPTGYAIAVLLAYCAVAGALDVNLVFAAFLSGFAIVDREHKRFEDSIDAISKVSFAFFIPVYFAIVGLKLDLIRGVSLPMMVIFIVGTCVVKMLSVGLAGRLAGFRGLDVVNLGITTNARGGPGIVLASVAFDAGIISSKFYTTLVVAAVLTSQLAGAWLDYVLRKGWPLLKSDVESEVGPETAEVSGENLAAANAPRSDGEPPLREAVSAGPEERTTSTP